MDAVSESESLRDVVSAHREAFELLAESDLPVAGDAQRILGILEDDSNGGEEQCRQ